MGSCVSVSVSFSRFTCEPLLLLLLPLGSTVQCHQIQSQSVQTAFGKMVQDQQYIVLNAVMKRHILRVYHPSLILIKMRNKKILPGFLFIFYFLFSFFLRCHLLKSEEQLPAASNCRLCVRGSLAPATKTSIVSNWQNFLPSAAAVANQGPARWRRSAAHCGNLLLRLIYTPRAHTQPPPLRFSPLNGTGGGESNAEKKKDSSPGRRRRMKRTTSFSQQTREIKGSVFIAEDDDCKTSKTQSAPCLPAVRPAGQAD